jgi:FKBP-type peptidyl-prolyl cis-trans isomerase FklB
MSLKKITINAAMSLVLTTTIVQAQVVLDSDDKKFSYAVGTKIGEQLSEQFVGQPDIDIDALLEALSLTVKDLEVQMSDEEVIAIIQQKQQQQLEAAAVVSREQLEAGKAFLDQNMTKEGVVVTESGLQYEIIQSGDPAGDMPTATDTVVVHYQGTLIDGTVFDSSIARGEPATFPVRGVISGWTEVLQLMRPGDKWAIVLAPELAYGERGSGQTIGPNEILMFDVELIEIKKSAN